MMLSYWEAQSFRDYDLVIVGGGIIGLTAAIYCREQRPHLSVAVLERGIFPAGASTRNVGFLSISTVSEMLSERRDLGVDGMLRLVQKRRDGIERLRALLGDAAIDRQECGGYEVLFPGDESVLDGIDVVNADLKALFGRAVFAQRDGLIPEFGFAKDRVRHLIHNHIDAQAHSGRAMKGLIARAQACQVTILTGAEVLRLEEEGASGVTVVLRTPESLCPPSDQQRATAVEPYTLRAAQVLACSNGLVRDLLPQIDARPARGQVLVTEYVPGLKVCGTFNFSEGYGYFRNIDGRIMFGGARNTDRAAEETATIALNASIHRTLETILETVILPGHRLPAIEWRWAGIMGFREPMQPLVQHLTDRIAVAFGCNGRGFAMGAQIGWEAAALY